MIIGAILLHLKSTINGIKIWRSLTLLLNLYNYYVVNLIKRVVFFLTVKWLFADYISNWEFFRVFLLNEYLGMGSFVIIDRMPNLTLGSYKSAIVHEGRKGRMIIRVMFFFCLNFIALLFITLTITLLIYITSRQYCPYQNDSHYQPNI